MRPTFAMALLALLSQVPKSRIADLPVHPYVPVGTPVGGVVFLSGDGGWRGFDKTNADSLRTMGYWVLGVDDLKLFFHEMSADSLAQVTARMIAHVRAQLSPGAPVYLAGYSFGADMAADAVGSHVSADGVILLGPSVRGLRTVSIGGLLFREPTGPTSFDVAERLNARDCVPVAFVTGDKDKAGKGAEVYGRVKQPVAEFLVPDAGHHYHGGDQRYMTVLRQALQWLGQQRANCPKP